MKKILASLFVAVIAFSSTDLAAQLQQHHDEAVAASSEVHAIPGGQQFSVPARSDKVFVTVVKELNLTGRTVESANRDSGLIATTMNITGGWKQTGTRLVITIIASSDAETIVRIASTEQKRYKALQTDPWSDPKVDAKATAAAISELRPLITAEATK